MFAHIRLFDLLIVAALTIGLYHARRFLHRSSPADRIERPAFLLLELTELTLAAIFFLVGGAKLIGQRDMIILFRAIGIGEWFRYLTGTVEVGGALLLVTPLLSGLSAIALGAVMIVASMVELFVLHRPPVAALACLSAHTFVAWSRVARGSAAPRASVVAAPAAQSALTRGLTGRWSFPKWVRLRDPLGAPRRRSARTGRRVAPPSRLSSTPDRRESGRRR